MKSETAVSVCTTLVLSKAEATWLNMVMQNPLHGTDPTSESPEDQAMRRLFWEATRAAAQPL